MGWFSQFDKIVACDRQTETHTHTHTWWQHKIAR